MAGPFARSIGSGQGAMFGEAAATQTRGRSELALDRVLDQRYRILEPLGVGGSAQVYLARDESLGRDVAIKVLDADAARDGALRRLFVREAQALAKLSHPNIVAVHDVGEADSLPFIVMEHLPGRSLKQLIERDGPLPVADAVRLAVEIASGLAFAHSRGIVHADLKPSNVLLDNEGHARIADFGIARTPQEDATTPQLFATAMYVAPERVEGRPVTASSDIYGLGLVLYEMLVGHPPFTSKSPSVLLRDHVVRQPVPPSHLRPSLPRELDSVVMRCLAKEPGLRYLRASDVARALAAFDVSPLAVTVKSAATEAMPARGTLLGELATLRALGTYGLPVRRALFALLAAAPAFAAMVLATFEPLHALIAAVAVAVVAAGGYLGIAMAITWLVVGACLFLFVPVLAVLFGFMGLWVWLRDVPPERAATAIALPVAAPLGLGPAFVLGSAAVHGLGGVAGAAWGAVLTVLLAVSAGRQAFGAYVQTGISVESGSLFEPARAIQTKAALAELVRPGSPDRFGLLLETFAPERLVDQLGTFVSRVVTADLAAIATILSWSGAALLAWAVMRLLRGLAETIFGTRPAFAPHVFATTAGVAAGAAFLYMLFVTWSPLANAPGRVADAVLFVSAALGAALALALAVVLAATRSGEADEEAEDLLEPEPALR